MLHRRDFLKGLTLAPLALALPDLPKIITPASALILVSATAFPIFKMVGPGQIYQLINHTTGNKIFFDLTLHSGEEVVLDLTPGQKTFTSTFRGNVIYTLLPISDVLTFHLSPGENIIRLSWARDEHFLRVTLPYP